MPHFNIPGNSGDRLIIKCHPACMTYKTYIYFIAGRRLALALAWAIPAVEIQIGTTWADVVPQALPKLQILLPGETAAPGTVPGKTGYPFPQLVGVPFSLTVHAVDAYWNVLNSSTDTVDITSTDDTATLPANAALLNGTATFSVTLNQTGSFTFTATDVSDGGIMNGVSSSVVVASPVPADMVTTHPWEAPGAPRNPLMGFRPYLNGWLNGSNPNPYTTVVHHYVRWNQIENHANDTVDKIRDFCDSQWANLPASNVKVVPRVYLDWDSNTGNEYWPADLASGDWTSQEFKDRVVRLIGRLGEVWDDDPRVAWVQTGIIGWWGEQENPVSVNADGWAQRMGDAYTDAFRNKKFVVRNMNHWPGHPVGVYWDSFGHPGQTNGSWNSIRNFNNQGRYLTQVIEGEVAYNWGENLFDPLYGGEPTITLGTGQYTDNMIDVIRELHASALGWISSYRTDGSFGTDPDVVRANAARMQAAFGYRFHITEFASSARTQPGANLEVRFKVKNKGSAPFYEN